MLHCEGVTLINIRKYEIEFKKKGLTKDIRTILYIYIYILQIVNI